MFINLADAVPAKDFASTQIRLRLEQLLQANIVLLLLLDFCSMFGVGPGQSPHHVSLQSASPGARQNIIIRMLSCTIGLIWGLYGDCIFFVSFSENLFAAASSCKYKGPLRVLPAGREVG